jgi:cyanophycinase
VLVMMEKLINNSRSEAIGIAAPAPGDPRPDLGFEFKLTRDASSVGYESATSDAYTILNLRMDVRPLKITQSWYQ